MCTLIAVLSAVSTVTSAAITSKAAYDQKVIGDYQTKMIVKEAEIAENNAKYELQEGIEESRRQKLKSILNMGEQKSNIAAGNIALSSQTAINIVDDEKLNGELDALNTLKSSEHRAESYFQQADRLYENAGLNSFRNKKNYQNRVALTWTNAFGSRVDEFVDGVDWVKKKVKKDGKTAK